MIDNKYDLILAIIITLSVICSSVIFYILPNNLDVFLWSIFFSLFLSYYRIGTTKLQQIYYINTYGILTLGVLAIAGFCTLMPEPYYSVLHIALLFVTLSISRFLPGGRVIGIFLTIYVLLFYSLYPHTTWNTLYTTLIDLTCGLSLALFFTACFIAILPLVKIVIVPADKNIILIKQAFRITISISVAYLLAHLYNLTNPLWIYATILVISQTHFGVSVKRAGERLLGTLIGAVIGAILAHFLFEVYPLSLYFSIIIIFFTFYFSRLNYTLAIIFATILITASFYLSKTHLHLELHQFIWDRVIDTLLGVIIGLLGELLIFPQSLMQIIRLNLSKSFQTMYEIFKLLEHQNWNQNTYNSHDNTNDNINNNTNGNSQNNISNNTSSSSQPIIQELNEKIITLEHLHHEFTLNLKLIQHELITYISKRYAYIHDVYSQTHAIHTQLKLLIKEFTNLNNTNLKYINQVNPSIFTHLGTCMQTLHLITPKSQLDDTFLPQAVESLTKYLKNLEVENKNIHDQHNQEYSQINVALIKLIQHVIKLIELYRIILATPYWLPKCGRLSIEKSSIK